MGRRQFGEPKSFFFFSVVWYRTARLCPPTLPSPHTPLQESVGPRQNPNWAEPLWQSQKHMMRCRVLAFGSNKAWWFMAKLRLGIMSTLQVTSKESELRTARQSAVFWRRGFEPDLQRGCWEQSHSGASSSCPGVWCHWLHWKKPGKPRLA